LTCLGIDVGGSEVKLALVKNGGVQRLCCFDLPEKPEKGAQLSELSESFSRQLRAYLRAEQIKAGRCALSLPQELAFVRRITVPWMTAKQLRLNLPFEFHDYIQHDKDLYFYDYAVVQILNGEDGKPQQLDLLAAASPKKVIEEWRAILGKAGLRLSVAVPQYLTYRNLITAYETAHPDDHPQEYCVVDMGAAAIRVHMYRGSAYETSRVIEYGGASVAALRENQTTMGAEQRLRDLYDTIAVEILRAVNFYGFNTPSSDLRDLYFCGGLAQDGEMMKTIRSRIQLNIHSVEELIPPGGDRKLAEQCPAAVGAALEANGR
jgi:type IV pilus assembly protein PilM